MAKLEADCQCIGCASTTFPCIDSWREFSNTDTNREAVYILVLGENPVCVSPVCVHSKPRSNWQIICTIPPGLTTFCFCTGAHQTGRINFNIQSYNSTVLKTSNPSRKRFGMVLYENENQEEEQKCAIIPRLSDMALITLYVNGYGPYLKGILPEKLLPERHPGRVLVTGCVFDRKSMFRGISSCLYDPEHCVNQMETLKL
jgi:hypothetical protein